MSGDGSILFYDGECGLCNAFVRFALTRDRERCFRYAPIGGETWDRLVNPEVGANPNTVYLLTDAGLYKRSSAVVRTLFGLGCCWRIAGGLLWLIPLPLRDLGYRCIAKLRYRIAGRVDACSLPATDEKDRLLP